LTDTIHTNNRKAKTMDKTEAEGPFWIEYRDRVPSTGWVDDFTHYEEFPTREERRAFATLGTTSTRRTGGWCPVCHDWVVDPVGVSPVALGHDGQPHECARVPAS
jgi:hypothetical protein